MAHGKIHPKYLQGCIERAGMQLLFIIHVVYLSKLRDHTCAHGKSACNKSASYITNKLQSLYWQAAYRPDTVTSSQATVAN